MKVPLLVVIFCPSRLQAPPSREYWMATRAFEMAALPWVSLRVPVRFRVFPRARDVFEALSESVVAFCCVAVTSTATTGLVEPE
ncbi:MAG: hypothetical protein A4E38_00317 [Methanoregulaceae archaeon PtaB.Bin108]|nr:MAG: hypothetical protein A4E38_00317 [Methanoregulaceae archaeon PtaB.Bin108]